MATKQQIFKKITELLEDINEQYQAQSFEGKETEDLLRADLFEATVNYFAAHVGIYNRLLKKEKEPSDAMDTSISGEMAEQQNSHGPAASVGGEESDPVINNEEDTREEADLEEANPREEVIFTPESESVYTEGDADQEVQHDDNGTVKAMTNEGGDVEDSPKSESDTREPEMPQSQAASGEVDEGTEESAGDDYERRMTDEKSDESTSASFRHRAT